MKLTPLEIRKQEFRKAMRGFDPVEVQTFLEMVAEQYEQLLDENNALNRRVIELETKLHDYQENERNLRETLLNVQEVKKQSEESSRRQADLIIKEAELKALEILEKARKQAQQIREEVNWLKSQKESFINRLRHILISQIELLSVMEIDDVIPEELRKVVQKGKSLTQTSSGQEKSAQDSENYLVIEREVPDEVVEKSEQSGPTPPKDDSGPESEHDTNAPTEGKDKNKASSIEDEDINEFFKKGIQIDDLIKNINKKEQDK
ncbi:MAG: DivIVA domain-containing protein [Calditrichaeota bacterium]|nr:MAG: DivIVA domain-containing protein [Calditrichota bacterium]